MMPNNAVTMSNTGDFDLKGRTDVTLSWNFASPWAAAF
jgi:hypothetical protein